jgi:hypothetical protein
LASLHFLQASFHPLAGVNFSFITSWLVLIVATIFS